MAAQQVNHGRKMGELAQSSHDNLHGCVYLVPIEAVPIQDDALEEETIGSLFPGLAYNDPGQYSRVG